jgi:hypothetical protein
VEENLCRKENSVARDPWLPHLLLNVARGGEFALSLSFSSSADARRGRRQR